VTKKEQSAALKKNAYTYKLSCFGKNMYPVPLSWWWNYFSVISVSFFASHINCNCFKIRCKNVAIKNNVVFQPTLKIKINGLF